MEAGAPPRREKNGGGAEFMGFSCKCTPEGECAPSEWRRSHFYWAEEDVAFNLGGIS